MKKKKMKNSYVSIGLVLLVLIPTIITSALASRDYYYDDDDEDEYYFGEDDSYMDIFRLTVRIIADDKDSMPNFIVKAGGDTEYIDGDEFKDDGEAKVTLILDREDMGFKERVSVKSTDGHYRDSGIFHPQDRETSTVNFYFD